MSTFANVIDNISANVPDAEKEYFGEDGFLHCAVCHARTETRFVVKELSIDKMVRCACDCRMKEIEAEEERKRKEEHERKRRICFPEAEMHEWTFANDDRQNEKLSDAMNNYVQKFSEFRSTGKGLLMYGPTSTGKTYFSACIANALIDRGYSVLMTNFARLTNTIQGMYQGRQEYIDGLNDYDLLIIDDLGTERSSEYMQEMVYNIIDSRYLSGLPFIITTNLTADELKKPEERAYKRIYERILQRCFPVEVVGVNRRRTELKETHAVVKAMLGL